MNNQTKAKIFALYYSCKAIIQEGCREYDIDSEVIYDTGCGRYGYKIMLTPLSQITDEDAIQVAKMASKYTGRIEISERFKSGIVFLFPYVSEKLFFRFASLSFYDVDFNRNEIETRSKYSATRSLEYIDYLRSKGYALPAFGYSIEELVKEGVFQLSPATATKNKQ